MQTQELIARLLKTNEKIRQRSLLKKHAQLIDLTLAEELKNTYYQFWTTEPRKTRNAATALECLFEILPLDEVNALANWVRGIAFLTEGKNERAIASLDAAARKFSLLQKPYQAAQTQVSKLYVLALLGRYGETVEVGEKALRIFEKYGDELAAGKIEMNLGNINLRRDFYLEAENFFLSAQKRFAKLGETMWLTMCENDLAIVYSAVNDFHRAAKFYSQSLAHAEAEKMSVTQAEIEASMGNLALFRGRFDEALNFLESSRQKYEILKMPHQKAIAELEIADIYLELNLLSESFEIYKKVIKILARQRMQGEQARARANFGRIAIIIGDEKLARRELKKAARLYLAEKNTVGAAAVLLSEAELEFSSQHFQKALKIAREAENLLHKTGNLRRLLVSRRLQGDALRKLKKFTESENLLKKTFADAVQNEQLNLAQTAQTSLGKLFVAQKNYRQAERHFRRAIELTEILRAPLPTEEFRMAFLANKLAPFAELAKIYLKENKIKEAFLLAENSRSRSLTETFRANELPVTTENSQKAIAKLNRVREELNWFYNRLNRAETDGIENLQREAATREKEISRLMRQIESTAQSTVFQGKAELDLEKLQWQLGAKRALIEYVILDGQISAFVVTDQQIEFFADLCAESEIFPLLEGLRFQFGALRYGAKHLGAFLPELRKRADFYLAKLYQKLLAPLENSIEKLALTIVPVGQMHYVPFNALFDGKQYTIEKCAVSFAPSATVLQICLSKSRQKFENALLVAHADERIPLVTREIEQLQKIFRQAKTLSGDQASVAAFTREAENFDVLHLACHGEFRPDSPLFSRLHLTDGAITVRDVCAQQLKASLVTLSACETGLNSVFAGDEILGLARGFLKAGVSSLVLSLWTVNDEATAELMSDFYKRLPKNSVSDALRLAQIELVKQDAHPYFWASFIVNGKW